MIGVLLVLLISGSLYKNRKRPNPIIKIENKDKELEITRQINNLTSNGNGTSYYSDGYIYFTRKKNRKAGDNLETGELNKMKEDASQITKLADDSASNIFLKDDWIYYINNSDFRCLYRIKTDGSQREKIDDEHRMFNFIYLDDWLYFTEYLNKKGQGAEYYGSPGTYQSTCLSRMKLDASRY